MEERCRLLDEPEARGLLPARDPAAHKGDAGRVLVLAGSPGKTGAAQLALLGALRGGAGLVTLAARAEVLPMALAGRPEAMSLALPGAGPLGAGDLQALVEAARGADALVAGPGLFRGAATGRLLRDWLGALPRPAVLDADALNALEVEPAWLGKLPSPVILTPHPGELARLCGSTAEAVQADRIGLAMAKAAAWGVVVVLKGARTVVAAPRGPAAVIPTGNAGHGQRRDRRRAGGALRRAAGRRPGSVRRGPGGGLGARRGRRPGGGAARAARPAGGRPGRGDRPGLGQVEQVNRSAPGAARSLTTRSARATWRLGQRLGAALRDGDVVTLIGDLGAGKTQLVRGLCAGAGVDEADVTSPTFAIVQTYRGRLPIHHADLYRLADLDELHATGLLDLPGSEGALVVEWADKVAGWAPAERLELRLEEVPGRPSVRRIALAGFGPRHAALAEALALGPAR